MDGFLPVFSLCQCNRVIGALKPFLWREFIYSTGLLGFLASHNGRISLVLADG